MKEEQKLQIATALLKRKDDSGLSYKVLANQIGKVSESLLNHIVKLRWQESPQLVSDSAFQRVSAFLKLNDDWQINKSDDNFQIVQLMCEDARNGSESVAISAQPGKCKTESLRDYSNRADVYYVSCEAHWTKKNFLDKIMQSMGISSYHFSSIAEKSEEIVKSILRKHKPLLIFDECDKLNDNIFQFFITFYNALHTNCGFLFCGSDFFELRVKRGVAKNRQGYAEFGSRTGDFEHLPALNPKCVAETCRLNGLTEQEHIQYVINTAGIDYRRVRRAVERKKKELALAGKGGAE
jgi:hypothetical protein